MGSLSVGVKLFASVGVTSLITVVIAVLGYVSLEQTGAAVSRVADTVLPRVAGLGMVKEGLLAAQSAERTILVPELANSKEFDRQRAVLDQGLALVDQGRSMVEGALAGNAEKAQWQRFEAALADWRKTNAKVVELVSQNKRSNALTLSIGTSMLSMRTAAQALTALLEQSRTQAENLARTTRDMAELGTKAEAIGRVLGVHEAVDVIESATTLADESGRALIAIVSLIEKASDQVRSIATASQEQSAAAEAIESTIADVNRVSAETAQAMERSTQAVAGLTEQARVLGSVIDELAGSGRPAALSA